jgi:hypothetical protein
MRVDRNTAAGANPPTEEAFVPLAAKTPPANPPSPARGPESGKETTRLDPELSAAIRLFADSPLLASGQISLVSLEAIAERLGSRWASRRASIHDYTERSLNRHFGDRGHFLRVSETDFLVMAPDDMGRFGAQLQGLQCLREVLTYFLGEPRGADLKVREVTRIGAEELEAVLVDPASVATAADREKTEASEKVDASHGNTQWSPFLASNGRRIRVSCALEPVLELKSFKRIGHRIVRRILYVETEAPLTAKELLALSRSDIERIDCATIDRGLQRLRADAGAAQALSLIIPVSYTSLSNRQGRTALARLFSEAKSLVKAGVICEVCDIENVPHAGLVEATSLIKPFCLFLIGRVNGTTTQGLSRLRGVGLRGISFDAPAGLSGDAEFVGWARPAINAVKGVAKSVLVYRLASPRHVGLAALLGATHVSLQVGILGPMAPARA